MYHKRIKRTINLRNAHIIVGDKKVNIVSQPNMAQRVRIRTIKTDKTTR